MFAGPSSRSQSAYGHPYHSEGEPPLLQPSQVNCDEHMQLQGGMATRWIKLPVMAPILTRPRSAIIPALTLRPLALGPYVNRPTRTFDKQDLLPNSQTHSRPSLTGLTNAI